MMDLEAQLREIQIGPILSGRSEKVRIDLSKESGLDKHSFEDYILSQMKAKPNALIHGGYLEERFFYENELLYGSGDNRRRYHLGEDLWATAGTDIHAPLAGVVHSMAYNGQHLDYGHTLILEHRIDASRFYTLYGHLSSWHETQLKAGDSVNCGQKIATLGNHAENGGWLPHLHLQMIINMGNHYGDYPGVASERDLHEQKSNCPDPNKLI